MIPMSILFSNHLYYFNSVKKLIYLLDWVTLINPEEGALYHRNM